VLGIINSYIICNYASTSIDLKSDPLGIIPPILTGPNHHLQRGRVGFGSHRIRSIINRHRDSQRFPEFMLWNPFVVMAELYFWWVFFPLYFESSIQVCSLGDSMSKIPGATSTSHRFLGGDTPTKSLTFWWCQTVKFITFDSQVPIAPSVGISGP
jgi:dolichol kinase